MAGGARMRVANQINEKKVLKRGNIPTTLVRPIKYPFLFNSGTHAFDSNPERIWLILMSQALHLPSAF